MPFILPQKTHLVGGLPINNRHATYENKNNQETILQLEELKLKGMAECYKSLQSLPVQEWPASDMMVARLAEAERQYRRDCRLMFSN